MTDEEIEELTDVLDHIDSDGGDPTGLAGKSLDAIKYLQWKVRKLSDILDQDIGCPSGGER